MHNRYVCGANEKVILQKDINAEEIECQIKTHRFLYTARLFKWVKKESRPAAKTNVGCNWVELYYGQILLDMKKLTISAVDNKDIFNHVIQSSMNLTPAPNEERGWMYKYKTNNKEEINYALRFQTKDEAFRFRKLFYDAVDIVKVHEEQVSYQESQGK